MSQLTHQQKRRIGLGLLFGLGLLLLTIPVYDIWADASNPHKTVTSTLIENSFPALMAGLLLGGTVWLERHDWDGEAIFRVARWASAAVLIASLLMVLVVGIQVLQNDLKPYIIAGDAIVAASVAGLVIGMYDARERRQREQLQIERDHLSALYQNTSDCIATFRHENGLTVGEVNKTFESVFERDVADVLADAEASDDIEDDLDDRIYRYLQNRDPFTAEIRVPTREDAETDGGVGSENRSWRDFMVRTVPTDNQHTYLVFTDITDQKERERLLKEREAELERKTSKREEQLERRTEQLQFLHSILRHDVQNGMMVIQSRADYIKDHVDGQLADYAETITSRSEDISDQIDRMRLTLDTLTTDEWTTEPVSLTDVATERVQALRLSYPDAEITMDVPEDLTVEADEMLDDVLDNLLQNAVQHNDKETPEIDVTATQQPETVRIEIADNGPGIPEDRREDVFRRGVSSANQSNGSGSGFGLFFVDTMITAYDGDIWIEGNDPGTRFVIELPRPSDEDADLPSQAST